MKILLDENLPHKLRHEISGHEVFTTSYMGWSGIENGSLLALAADAGFDVLVTNDRGIEYEQNPATLPVAVILLLANSNTIEAIRPILSKLRHALTSVKRGELTKLQCT